jgi:integrase
MRGEGDLVFGLKVEALGAAFRRFREQAGISGLTFHDARHTAATWLVRDSRLNAFELCRIMGWTDPKMAMIYYQPAVGDLVKRLGGRR